MWQARPVLYEVIIVRVPSFLPFRYSTSLLGEPGSPSIVVGPRPPTVRMRLCLDHEYNMRKRGVLEIKCMYK